MDRYNRLIRFSLALLLVATSVPLQAWAGLVSGCSLEWDQYRVALQSSDLRGSPSLKAAFDKCNVALKSSAGYKKASTSYASVPSAGGAKERAMLSYSYFYSESGASVPASAVSAYDKAIYQQGYAAAMMKYKDDKAYTQAQRQAFAKDWGQKQLKKEQDFQQKMASIKFETPVMASDNTRVDNTSAKIKGQMFEQQLNSEDLSAQKFNSAIQANKQAVAKYSASTGPKTEKDLVPVFVLADAGEHVEYSIIPIFVGGKPKLDMKGRQMYYTFPTKKANTALVFDEVRITYKGKPAVASLTAIGRDLLNFKSTKSAVSIQTITQAVMILVNMLDTAYGDEALDKLALAGAILVAAGEQTASQQAVNRIANTFVNHKDYYMRSKAAMALGLLGSMAPMRSDLANGIIDLLGMKAANYKKGQVWLAGQNFWIAQYPVLSKDFQIRAASLMALSSIGTWDAIVALGSIPRDLSLFSNSDCEDCEDFYYSCNPAYSQEAYSKAKEKEHQAYNEAANDGAIQCLTPRVLSGFMDPGATAEQKGYAVRELRSLAREDQCGATAPSKKWPYLPQVRPLSNSAIHATLILSSYKMIAPKCLEPIAHHVTIWEGNTMKLPCEIVNSTQLKLGEKPRCETNMHWHEVVSIVEGVVTDLVAGALFEGGIGGVATGLVRISKSCRALAKAAKVAKAGELGYKVFDTANDYVEWAGAASDLTKVATELALAVPQKQDAQAK